MSDINDRMVTIDAPKPGKGDEDRARLTVASNAKDAEDCAVLLDMLGLLPAVEQRQVS